MSLFTFHNEFDDVTVGLDDNSPVVDGQITHAGPFEVTVVFGDDSIKGAEVCAENYKQSFPTLREAKAKFFELCEVEFTAVLDDGRFE